MGEDWIESYYKKPETFKVVHGITKVGKETDVVEAWWTGDEWVVPSSRSKMISNNILFWKEKPKIPDHILEKIKKYDI